MGAIPIHIKIGDVETLRTENWRVIPDDRQTRLETIGGNVIQDFGRVDSGDTFSCSVTLSAAAASVVSGYWYDRTPVTVRDVSGRELTNRRVVIKKYGYVDRFEDEYFTADIEFWENTYG